MKRYDCYPQIDNNDYLHWYVYEKISEQIVAEFFFEDDAVDYTLFLNKGGAFDGFTPKYILTEIKYPNHKEVLNKKFESLLTE